MEDRQLSVFSVWQITNYGRESHSAISDRQPSLLHVSVIAGYIAANPSAPSLMEDGQLSVIFIGACNQL